jgi:hypothetical protein
VDNNSYYGPTRSGSFDASVSGDANIRNLIQEQSPMPTMLQQSDLMQTGRQREPIMESASRPQSATAISGEAATLLANSHSSGMAATQFIPSTTGTTAVINLADQKSWNVYNNDAEYGAFRRFILDNSKLYPPVKRNELIHDSVQFSFNVDKQMTNFPDWELMDNEKFFKLLDKRRLEDKGILQTEKPRLSQLKLVECRLQYNSNDEMLRLQQKIWKLFDKKESLDAESSDIRLDIEKFLKAFVKDEQDSFMGRISPLIEALDQRPKESRYPTTYRAMLELMTSVHAKLFNLHKRIETSVEFRRDASADRGRFRDRVQFFGPCQILSI